VDEPHVEHAVGFVEHEDLHAGQVQRALLVMVEQPPGVATRMSTPLRRRSICGCMPTPPNMTMLVS
jgi:hypothetical protein